MDNNNNNRSSLGADTIVKLVAFALLLLVGGVLLSTLTPVIFPPKASAEADSVDELFRILLVLGGIVFFLIQGLLVISVIAFRARPGDQTDGQPNHGNMTLEIVWTIIPSLVVAFLAILSFNVWQQNTTPKENENMVNGESIAINVTGAQYAWTHAYDTPEVDINGEPIVIRTGNELHVYAGQNVKLVLQTQDVIHSYWVPAMRVKQDLLPGNPDEGGRPTELRFTPIVPDENDDRVLWIDGKAEFPIVCAELCGDGHGGMTGRVVVYPNHDTFVREFYDPRIEELRVPPSDPIERGAQDITVYGCQGCHVLDQLGWTQVTGPSLNTIGANAGGRISGYSAEEYLAESVWHSTAYLVPGYQGLMPVFGPTDLDPNATNQISPEELYSIVAYLCTIPSPEDSDCDIENITESVPAAIDNVFGVQVDVTFGMGEGASAEATAEPGAEATQDPSAEATDEPDAEATQDPESEATEEAGS